MSEVEIKGRLGNKINIYLAACLFAKKHNLFINYNPEHMKILKNLGIELFIGTNNYLNTEIINDNNYLEYYNKEKINFNVKFIGYFQTKKITDKIHLYLNSNQIINNIKNNNKYNLRYNNNNDCFIHIRLGDVHSWNPGYKYYNDIITKLSFDNLYIATDSPKHKIINKLKKTYNNLKMMDNNLVNIFLFGSTCKYVILSYGTFSAFLGYISFFSTVYCIKFSKKYAWDYNAKDECDMFRNKFTKINKWIECIP